MVAGGEGSFAESILEARRLLESWERLGRAHMMIGGACSCGIGGVVVALEDFEQDIADYLQAEAERLERQDVLAYMGHEARNGDLWSIDKLLSSLARPAASTFYEVGGSTFLLDRLGRTLQSFEKLHGSA
jgi:hypothetical protein